MMQARINIQLIQITGLFKNKLIVDNKNRQLNEILYKLL